MEPRPRGRSFGDGSDRVTLLLTPTLLGELDDLEGLPRPESVRDKSEGLIRRTKEYGRRGDLHSTGVTLRKGRSVVRAVAVEPDFSQTLPWLDPTVPDDRLIALMVEVMRQHPHSRVALVTRDVNMQALGEPEQLVSPATSAFSENRAGIA